MEKEAVANEWIRRWGKGKLQAFQDAFARAFGISLCLVNLEGVPLTVWSNSSLFCHYMLQNNRQRCLRERDNAIRQATETGRPYLSRCYMGLSFFFHPVVYRHDIICLVYGGGFYRENEMTGAAAIDNRVPVLSKKHFENMLAVLAETLNLANPVEGGGQPAEQPLCELPLLQQKLSNREIQIVHLINAGLPNKEIGEQLFISEKTVKTHVSNILSKMGIKDRMQLVVFCRQNNIN